MALIAQHIQQVFISPDAASVLRWAGLCAIQTAGNEGKLCPGPEIFDRDEMLPAIAEIIFIDEMGSLFRGNLPQPDAPITQHPVLKLRVRLPVARCTDDELVQVGMLPPHHDLEQVMKAGEHNLA